MTTRIGDRAGIASVPNVLTKLESYQQMRELTANLGEDVVIQTAYGDSGHTTFFISNEADWNKYAAEIVADPEVKIMKRIRCRGAAQEACVTRHGTIVGPMMTELVGFKELTPYRGGWCGNEVLAESFSQDVRAKACDMTFRFGEELRKMGYRGYFELDFLRDLDSDELYLSGCSQAVWTRDESFLIRNYDYNSKLWEGLLLRTCWNGKHVMAMSDCLWGVLDGMNEDGLAVSLAFGGRKALGDGFGIPLILRYILEFCDTTAQATEVLSRIPSHMAYNVTVLDRAGAHATVFISPDKDTFVSRRMLATNHQDTVDWPEHARATASLDRAHVLSLRLQDPTETHERFVTRFLEPPLYQHNHQHGWGTLYTTTYNPSRGVLTCRWPGYCLERTIENFPEQAVALRFG